MRQGSVAVVGDIDRYMAEIQKIPVLTAEEERILARRYREEGDLEAAHRLVTSNLRFVVKITHEYRGYGLLLKDLIQEGNLGLMVAVRRFDPSRGVRLITYAVFWIRAYIQSFILRSWSMVTGGTERLKRLLMRRALPAPAAGEVPEATHDVTDEALAPALSLDAPAGDDQETALKDLLADRAASPEEQVADAETRSLVRERLVAALAALTPRERAIVKARVLDEPPVSLAALADQCGISRERVRQIEAGALAKIRAFLPAPPSEEGLAWGKDGSTEFRAVTVRDVRVPREATRSRRRVAHGARHSQAAGRRRREPTQRHT